MPPLSCKTPLFSTLKRRLLLYSLLSPSLSLSLLAVTQNIARGAYRAYNSSEMFTSRTNSTGQHVGEWGKLINSFKEYFSSCSLSLFLSFSTSPTHSPTVCPGFNFGSLFPHTCPHTLRHTRQHCSGCGNVFWGYLTVTSVRLCRLSDMGLSNVCCCFCMLMLLQRALRGLIRGQS